MTYSAEPIPLPEKQEKPTKKAPGAIWKRLRWVCAFGPMVAIAVAFRNNSLDSKEAVAFLVRGLIFGTGYAIVIGYLFSFIGYNVDRYVSHWLFMKEFTPLQKWDYVGTLWGVFLLAALPLGLEVKPPKEDELEHIGRIMVEFGTLACLAQYYGAMLKFILEKQDNLIKYWGERDKTGEWNAAHFVLKHFSEDLRK